ncbi:MAG: hypothetical protein NVSMB66_7160 [Candidatus Doudnabacteria bacterium]
MNPEELKKSEEKKEVILEEIVPSPILINSERISALVKIRSAKLQAVKPFISLKLYQQITMKLQNEEHQLVKEEQVKSKEAEKQNREQTLSKSFFEQRLMKIKTIRID